MQGGAWGVLAGSTAEEAAGAHGCPNLNPRLEG